ncbi:MAG: hypothetical protein RIT14_2670 [Pseudomonadota bacterium]
MTRVQIGRLSFALIEGDLRGIALDGVEVLRRLSYPVRDSQWGTLPAETLAEAVAQDGGHWTYRRRFAGRGGVFDGSLRAEVWAEPGGARLRLEVEMSAPADLAVNRAGFTLLHPLRGVAGQPLRVTHADGTQRDTHWPLRISPAQPVFDIAGLAHEVAGLGVEIRMSGDIFEMEDQRNWSDASYKTYCRPLRLPLPYRLGPDHPVRQVVDITVTGRGTAPTGAAAGAAVPVAGVVPQVAVAAEPGLTTAAARAAYAGLPLLLRVRADVETAVLADHAGGAVTLEVILPEGASPAAALARLAARCAAAGLVPARVVALPAPYMASHQPDGPWPEGPAPMDLLPALRAAFPGVPAGGGVFTNFTEFNRCPPDPARVDFMTYGTSAIVHAADDLSVLETLEALPDIHATAREWAGDRPLHLGLCAIAMRSNPYAADCLPNPRHERLAMVRDDPRQETRFAAGFAAGVLAAATAGGVASVALCMTDGPLGGQAGGRFRPVHHLLRFAARLAELPARVRMGAEVRIATVGGTILANLGGDEIALPAGARGRVICAATEAAAACDGDWACGPALALGGVRLAPLDVALLEGDMGEDA